jgi:acetoin utilization protein AcuB
MLVRDVMQSNVVTVVPGTTLPEAIRLTRERGIRHLPVLEDARLVGIVSDRDLKRAMASSATSLETHELHYLLDRVTMGAIMTRAVKTIGPAFTVEEAARIMATEKISSLPVTENEVLVGIITETDLLELFVRLLGVAEPSSRLEVVLGPERAALAEVVGALGAAGIGISSVVTLVRPDGSREAIIRIPTIDPGRAVEAIEARGYKLRTLADRLPQRRPASRSTGGASH